jgi:hypothetical protein
MRPERDGRIIGPDSAHSAHNAPLFRLRARFGVPAVTMPATSSTASPSTPPTLAPSTLPIAAEPPVPDPPAVLPLDVPVPAAQAWPCWFSPWPERYPDHRRRWRSRSGLVLCSVCASPAHPGLVAEWLDP